MSSVVRTNQLSVYDSDRVASMQPKLHVSTENCFYDKLSTSNSMMSSGSSADQSPPFFSNMSTSLSPSNKAGFLSLVSSASSQDCPSSGDARSPTETTLARELHQVASGAQLTCSVDRHGNTIYTRNKISPLSGESISLLEQPSHPMEGVLQEVTSRPETPASTAMDTHHGLPPKELTFSHTTMAPLLQHARHLALSTPTLLSLETQTHSPSTPTSSHFQRRLRNVHNLRLSTDAITDRDLANLSLHDSPAPSKSPFHRSGHPSGHQSMPDLSQQAALLNDIPNLTLLDRHRFEELKELGNGSGGTVHLVLCKATKQVMARKTIHGLDQETRLRWMKEISILQQCQSDYIVKGYGVSCVEDDMMVCMEYMDMGSLDRVLQVSNMTLPESVLAHIAESVLRGLLYLYDQHKILHRDIKPSNVLLNSQGAVKLCDFGVSAQLVHTLRAHSFVGTSKYMSPERINGGIYAIQSDVWSLGVCLVEMATGQFPFGEDEPTKESTNEDSFGGKREKIKKPREERDDNDDPSQDMIMETLSSSEDNDPVLCTSMPKKRPVSFFDILQSVMKDPLPELPAGLSASFKDFVKVCLTKEATERPSPSVLLEHPWLVEFRTDKERQQRELLMWVKEMRTVLDDRAKLDLGKRRAVNPKAAHLALMSESYMLAPTASPSPSVLTHHAVGQSHAAPSSQHAFSRNSTLISPFGMMSPAVAAQQFYHLQQQQLHAKIGSPSSTASPRSVSVNMLSSPVSPHAQPAKRQVHSSLMTTFRPSPLVMKQKSTSLLHEK